MQFTFAQERNPFAESFRVAAAPSSLSNVSKAPEYTSAEKARDSPEPSADSAHAKRERRKERNRLAAQTCRQKKIERYCYA